MYNKLHEKYLQMIDKNIPYNMLSKKETKGEEKPWISKAGSTSIKIKIFSIKIFAKTRYILI